MRGKSLICELRLIYAFCCRYTATPLAAFPERFPETVQSAKGDFPFATNTPDWFEYVGPPPSLDYYVTVHTPEKKKKDLEKYLAEYAGPWSFKENLHSYMVQDVRYAIFFQGYS